MSRNGSGTYTLPAGNPVVTGTTISSTWANSTLTNIASALTDSLAADGQTTATGNLKMGNNRITGLADGIASTDAASVSQVTTAIAGLGTMATQNANAVAVTGGTVNGTTIGATTPTTATFTTATVTKIEDSQGGVLAPISSVMRNRIINGAMVISQYNGTSSNTPVNNGYPIDRFIYKSTQASKFTAQQVTTAPAGFINSLQLTVASAVTIGSSDFFAIGQRIEGLNLYDIGFGTAACKPTNLSFQVRSSLTGTFGGALTNAAGDASYAFTYTISAANTWTSISIAVPAVTIGTWVTDNSNCLQVWFGLGVGSTYNGTAGSWVNGNNFSATGATSVVATAGATFLVTGVQLEKGTQATSFEYRQYQQELALCQRYFVTATMAVNTVGSMNNWYWNMRASPTVTGGGAGFTVNASSAYCGGLYQTTQGSQTLLVSAEL